MNMYRTTHCTYSFIEATLFRQWLLGETRKGLRKRHAVSGMCFYPSQGEVRRLQKWVPVLFQFHLKSFVYFRNSYNPARIMYLHKVPSTFSLSSLASEKPTKTWYKKEVSDTKEEVRLSTQCMCLKIRCYNQVQGRVCMQVSTKQAVCRCLSDLAF